MINISQHKAQNWYPVVGWIAPFASSKLQAPASKAAWIRIKVTEQASIHVIVNWPSRWSLRLSLALFVDHLPSIPSMRHLKSEDILLSNQCLLLSHFFRRPSNLFICVVIRTSSKLSISPAHLRKQKYTNWKDYVLIVWWVYGGWDLERTWVTEEVQEPVQE